MIIDNIEIKPEWSTAQDRVQWYHGATLKWIGDEPIQYGDTFVLTELSKVVDSNVYNVELTKVGKYKEN
jgi:hypothetical protein